MNAHHTDDPCCILCEQKLLTAHEYLGKWFHKAKAKYANLHIAWAYRNAEEQEQAVADKKTKLHYPNSPHNHMVNGKPYSLALDVFQLDEDGVARFSPIFCAKLNAENEAQSLPLLWGGNFKDKNGKLIHDYDHFQVDLARYKEPSDGPSAA